MRVGAMVLQGENDLISLLNLRRCPIHLETILQSDVSFSLTLQPIKFTDSSMPLKDLINHFDLVSFSWPKQSSRDLVTLDAFSRVENVWTIVVNSSLQSFLRKDLWSASLWIYKMWFPIGECCKFVTLRLRADARRFHLVPEQYVYTKIRHQRQKKWT